MADIKSVQHPLAEVFGFPITDFSKNAIRFRKNKLCPFNNNIPNCTKDKANNPLGVCSIFHNSSAVITCPVRFRENWLITEGAADFFFPDAASWTSIPEINLDDANGKTAGHIDLVLIAYDDKGKITDFGALEIQAVYISGNVRRPFETFMENPKESQRLVWRGNKHYPKPDYLSSSRKRLIPQLLYKGGILQSWGKKQAVALQKSFFETLPPVPIVTKEEAEIAWLIYDIEREGENQAYHLIPCETVYTKFSTAMKKMSQPEAGTLENFLNVLQGKLDEHLGETPPDSPELSDIIF